VEVEVVEEEEGAEEEALLFPPKLPKPQESIFPKPPF